MNDTISIRLFKHGANVWYQGRPHTVNFVTIREYKLFVTLNGLELLNIPEDQIQIEHITLSTKRNIA